MQSLNLFFKSSQSYDISIRKYLIFTYHFSSVLCIPKKCQLNLSRMRYSTWSCGREQTIVSLYIPPAMTIDKRMDFSFRFLPYLFRFPGDKARSLCVTHCIPLKLSFISFSAAFVHFPVASMNRGVWLFLLNFRD